MFDQQHTTNLTKQLISFGFNAKRMEPEHVSVFNSFAETPPQGDLDIAGHTLSYKWVPVLPDHIRFTQRATFRGSGLLLDVFVSQDIAAIAMDASAYAAMDHKLKAMVCQHFATPLIRTLSKHFDVSLDMDVEIDPHAPTDDTPFRFEIVAPGIGAPFYVQLACSQDLTQAILTKGTGAPQRVTRNPLNPRFKVVRHGLSVPKSALDRLQVGDVLFGSVAIAAQQDWSFEVAGICVGAVCQHERGFVLSKLSIQRENIENRNGGNMPKESLREILESRTSAMMSLELAQGELSAGDLEEMAVGQIIEFDEDVFETVRLRVNGELFADAEIVWVADKIGIKITGLK